MSIRKVSDLSTLQVMGPQVQKRDGRFIESSELSNSYFELSFKRSSAAESAQFQSNKVKYADMRCAFNADVLSGNVTFYGDKTFAGNTVFNGRATFNGPASFNSNISASGAGDNVFTGRCNVLNGDAVISGNGVSVCTNVLRCMNKSRSAEYLSAANGVAKLTISASVEDGYQLSVPDQVPFWDPPDKVKVIDGVPSWTEPPNGRHTVNINYLVSAYMNLLKNAYLLNNFEVKYLDYLDVSLSSAQSKMLITYRGDDNEQIWWKRENFPNAYDMLVNDFNNGSSATEDGVAYKLAPNKHKVCAYSSDVINNLNAALKKYGTAWFYVIDITNKRFMLPRSKLLLQGVQAGAVAGSRIKPALPYVNVDVQKFTGIESTFTGGTGPRDAAHRHALAIDPRPEQTKNLTQAAVDGSPMSDSWVPNGSSLQPWAPEFWYNTNAVGYTAPGESWGSDGSHSHNNITCRGVPKGRIQVSLKYDKDPDSKDIYRSGVTDVQPGATQMYIYMTCN